MSRLRKAGWACHEPACVILLGSLLGFFMKSKARHELKQNELAEAAGRVLVVVGEHRRQATTTIIAVVVVALGIGGFFAWRMYKASSR